MQNWSLYSFLLLTCKSFWQITFSRYTFLKLFPRIWNQRKILRFLDTHMLKNKNKQFWGHGVHIWVFFGNNIMQIHKKWLNQLKNFFNKHFKEYSLESFCWWIPSSCENHCNLIHRFIITPTPHPHPSNKCQPIVEHHPDNFDKFLRRLAFA